MERVEIKKQRRHREGGQKKRRERNEANGENKTVSVRTIAELYERGTKIKRRGAE